MKLSDEKNNYIKCYAYPKGYVDKNKVYKNLQLVNKYKVFIAKAMEKEKLSIFGNNKTKF